MEQKTQSEIPGIRRKRPFILTMLCAFAFVFYGTLGLLLMTGAFYSGFLAEIFRTYQPGDSLNSSSILLFFLGLALLHWGAFASVVWIWRLNRKGYFIFSGCALATAVFHLFLPDISILVTSVHISLILLFGLFYNFYQL